MGGGRSSEERAQKYLKAYKGEVAYQAKKPIKTTTQTPGTGGMVLGRTDSKKGLGIQAQRQREVGEQNKRSASFEPELEDNIYDIYD